MRPTDPRLEPSVIRELLAEVGRELAARDLVGDLYVVGGAAMFLSGVRETRRTQDVDALIRGNRDEVLEVAALVARRHSPEEVPEDWLNTRVTMWTSLSDTDPGATRVEFGGGLSVTVASPERLLALKLGADRPKDSADIAALVEVLDVTDPEEVRGWIEDAFGERVDAGRPEGVDMNDALMRVSVFIERRPGSPTLPDALSPPRGRALTDPKRTCGVVVASTGLPCLLRPGHRGSNHRSRLG